MENKDLISELDESAPIFNNLSPMLGALSWAQSLEKSI